MNKFQLSSDLGLIVVIEWDTDKITQDVVDDMVATVDLWAKRVTRGIGRNSDVEPLNPPGWPVTIMEVDDE